MATISPLVSTSSLCASWSDSKQASPTPSHAASQVAPAFGTVAFTNVVKTAEPLFTCLFSYLFLGQLFALPVYLSLLPVVFGVCLASASEAPPSSAIDTLPYHLPTLAPIYPVRFWQSGYTICSQQSVI